MQPGYVVWQCGIYLDDENTLYPDISLNFLFGMWSGRQTGVSYMRTKRFCIVVLILSLGLNLYLGIRINVIRTSEKPLFDPFEINYNVSEAALLGDGYEQMPEDVPLFGKQIGDTLIYYQMDYECEDVGPADIEETGIIPCRNTKAIWRNCLIYLDKKDSLEIERLVNRYDADVISRFETREDSMHSTERELIFFVKHRFSKQIFKCRVGIDFSETGAKRYAMSIENEFPWDEKDILERRWIYDRLDSLRVKENSIDAHPGKEVTVSLIKDGIEMSQFELNVDYVREESDDTLHVKSLSNRITVPLYDSTIHFFRVRYDEYSIDFSGLFLQYELPKFLHPRVSDWYFRVDTPPFQGLRQGLDPNETKYLLELYTDAKLSSGVSIPVPY